jgi:alcohol dehydrogenase class IV
MFYKKDLIFQFYSPTRILFGEGECKKIGQEALKLGAKRIAVIVDQGIKDSEMVKTVIYALGELCIGVFEEVVPDSGIDLINRGAAYCLQIRSDALVSIGGGSTIDTAKAIGALIKKGGRDIREYIGMMKIREPVLPHIAIPTTAGTGSESTMYSMIVDREKGEKKLMGDFHLIPEEAILDPWMTIHLPPSITASTGMDALSHCIESILSVRHGPMTDALAVYGIRLIAHYLPKCVERGEDIEARGMQAIAANMAGTAFSNALIGCVHAMAHVLGGKHGVPHGMANAILLPYGMEYNGEVVPQRYRLIAEAMGFNTTRKDDRECVTLATEKIREFSQRIGISQRLSDWGVKESSLEDVAKMALKDPAMVTNPRRPNDYGEILSILTKAL